MHSVRINMILVHVKIQFACLVSWLIYVVIAYGPLVSFSFVISFEYFTEQSTTITRINLQI